MQHYKLIICTSIHTLAFGGLIARERPMDQEPGTSNRMEQTVVAIGSSDTGGGERMKKPNEESGEESSSCSIDVVAGNESICRVCHLSAKESGNSSVELIEIGCECKGELGFAHLQCAEAWFRVKGNRLCEICGVAARNISGGGDGRFLEAWNERGSNDATSYSSDGSSRCLHGQPVCNFLMGCLVISFILPWFFRVDLF